MPIRFRCAYCNQLMAIARRKVGAVVRCPKCAGEVIVPTPPDHEPASGETSADELNAILEGDEFDRAFDVEPDGAAPGPTATATAKPEVLTSREEPAVVPPGMYLPRGMLFVLLALALLMLGTTFLAGFLVGRLTGS